MMRDWFDNLADRILEYAPERLRQNRRLTLSIAGGVGVVLIAAVSWIVVANWRTRTPDVWDDDLDDVAGFFFDEDFNNLPVKERMKLLQEFVARFRDGGQEETAMLAMFLSDVSYDMRKQVEDNVIRLGVDMWSEWGREYEDVLPYEREAYLDHLLLEMEKMGQSFNGRESTRTEEERLDRMERQAQRDRNRAQEWSGGKPPDADTVSGFLGLYSNEFAPRANAEDRARIFKLTRDLTRHIRGESLNNGGGGG